MSVSILRGLVPGQSPRGSLLVGMESLWMDGVTTLTWEKRTRGWSGGHLASDHRFGLGVFLAFWGDKDFGTAPLGSVRFTL